MTPARRGGSLKRCVLGLALLFGGGALAAGPDAGVRPAPAKPASAADEDAEVVENLELLENLDASADFELLVELSEAEEADK